jgi:uncharacterized membrane protein YheB (UPF0754 family)
MEKLMSIYVLVLIPLISALIGWITNYLAVKMIFRPYKEISILGIKIQGLMPKRKANLAEQIGNTVEKELISHDDIKKAIDSPDFHKELSTTVVAAIENVIVNKLAASNPMVGMFLTGELLENIKAMLATEVEESIPQFMGKMFEKLEGTIDFKELVRHKIEDFDMHKLEDIVYDIASKELKAIEVFGAVLGFVVGIVQVGIITILG